MQERRIIFILILLGVLFYVDVTVYGWIANVIIYPLVILAYIVMDIIVMFFPRRLALALLVLIVLVNLWNIFNNTFLITNCTEILLPWGIFGEKISYCTIKRLIYQTITSLMVSAAFTLLNGGTDNLFFCNVNIYRSTGTANCRTQDAVYVSSMRMESMRSVDAKKANIPVEIT